MVLMYVSMYDQLHCSHTCLSEGRAVAEGTGIAVGDRWVEACGPCVSYSAAISACGWFVCARLCVYLRHCLPASCSYFAHLVCACLFLPIFLSGPPVCLRACPSVYRSAFAFYVCPRLYDCMLPYVCMYVWLCSSVCMVGRMCVSVYMWCMYVCMYVCT